MCPTADCTSLARDGFRLEDLLRGLAAHHVTSAAHRTGDIPGPSRPHQRDKPSATCRHISQSYSRKLRLTAMGYWGWVGAAATLSIMSAIFFTTSTIRTTVPGPLYGIP